MNFLFKYLPSGLIIGQAEPEGEHREDDGSQADEHENSVPQVENLGSNSRLVGKVEQAGSVEHHFRRIVQDEQAESEPGEAEDVGGRNTAQIEGGVRHSGRHIFALHFLEVELRVRVQLKNVNQLKLILI